MDTNNELKNEALSAIEKLSSEQRAELWNELVHDGVISGPPTFLSHG